MSECLLSMQGICKSFPGVQALDGVDFTLHSGEVHALVGENGAGKSTLMKILGGVYRPDAGAIALSGQAAEIRSPIDSLSKGISIIYQEFNLVPTLTVSENIFLGKELRGKTRMVDRKAMHRKAREILNRLGMQELDCENCVERLSVAQQQMVEIAKALFNDSRIVVMDEPTAVLTDKESEALFSIIETLQSSGVGVVYISHRLEEVIRLSHRITVLRDGRFVTELANTNRDVQKEVIVRFMVGRELTDYYPPRAAAPEEETVLQVKGLSSGALFRDVGFSLKKREILGFFGLVGAGRTEVMKTLFGDLRADGGTVEVHGKPVRITKPTDAIARAMALVPEDRKHEGLVMNRSLSDNVSLPNAGLVSRSGVMRRRKKTALAQKTVRELKIRPADIDRDAGNFSGGNQQKIVVGKWLAAAPEIMILDEPTRGIDIAAKREIYDIINRLTTQGVSVIVVSSEMMEVLGICDRIIVMHEGCVTGEFENNGVTQEQLMACAAGLAPATGGAEHV